MRYQTIARCAPPLFFGLEGLEHFMPVGAFLKLERYMHYYKRNIGDYHKKAGRLSLLQHGVYNLLIDACYDREQFPTREQAIDWVWAGTPEEINAVDFVLAKFFTLEDGKYVQSRIMDEVDAYQSKCAENKRIANERHAKRKEKYTNRKQDVRESVPNQEPLTINQDISSKEDKSFQENDASEIRAAIDCFNRFASVVGWPVVKKITQRRKAALRARLKDCGGATEFEALIAKASKISAFTGNNDRNWVADFDFFMQQKSFVKLMEGGYDGWGQKKANGLAERPEDYEGQPTVQRGWGE